MPCPTARKAVPMAAVVLPLPGPVFTMMRPRRMSGIPAKLRLYLFPGMWARAPRSCGATLAIPPPKHHAEPARHLASIGFELRRTEPDGNREVTPNNKKHGRRARACCTANLFY